MHVHFGGPAAAGRHTMQSSSCYPTGMVGASLGPTAVTQNSVVEADTVPCGMHSLGVSRSGAACCAEQCMQGWLLRKGVVLAAVLAEVVYSGMGAGC